MARILVLVDDLMFGSRVLAMLQEPGHDVELAGPDQIEERLGNPADVLVADLTTDVDARITLLERLRDAGTLSGTRTLAFYSHVEADVRARAQDAGVELVVPRSRMAREGAALVDGLLTA